METGLGLIAVAVLLAALFNGKRSGSGVIRVNHHKDDPWDLKPGDKLKIDHVSGTVTKISIDSNGK